jgi:hypothetical protein
MTIVTTLAVGSVSSATPPAGTVESRVRSSTSAAPPPSIVSVTRARLAAPSAMRSSSIAMHERFSCRLTFS